MHGRCGIIPISPPHLLKNAPYCGGRVWTRSNPWFFEPTDPLGISVESAVFPQYTFVINGQADRQNGHGTRPVRMSPFKRYYRATRPKNNRLSINVVMWTPRCMDGVYIVQQRHVTSWCRHDDACGVYSSGSDMSCVLRELSVMVSESVRRSLWDMQCRDDVLIGRRVDDCGCVFIVHLHIQQTVSFSCTQAALQLAFSSPWIRLKSSLCTCSNNLHLQWRMVASATPHLRLPSQP